MSNFTLKIRQELIDLSEEKFKLFAERLNPNINNILGIRIPILRKLAKKLAKDNPFDYLNSNDEIYYEEVLLKALIIGNLKQDIDVIFKQLENFIPKINCWSICDCVCSELKIIKKNQSVTWNFIQKYLNSNNTYDIRFAVVIMIFHFIDEEHISDILNEMDKIKHDDYYVKMAVAWNISICFIKFPEKTMSYLKNNTLDKFTYNKALQKIIESYKVDKETKNIIRQMKRLT